MKIEILGYCTLSLWEDEYKDVEISRDMVRIFKHDDSIKTIRIKDGCDKKLNGCKIHADETSPKKVEKQGNRPKVEDDPQRINHPPHDRSERPGGIFGSSSTRIEPEAQKSTSKEHPERLVGISGSSVNRVEYADVLRKCKEFYEKEMGIYSSSSTKIEPEAQKLISNLDDLTEKIQKLEISDNKSTLCQPKILDSGLRTDLLPSERAKTQNHPIPTRLFQSGYVEQPKGTGIFGIPRSNGPPNDTFGKSGKAEQPKGLFGNSGKG